MNKSDPLPEPASVTPPPFPARAAVRSLFLLPALALLSAAPLTALAMQPFTTTLIAAKGDLVGGHDHSMLSVAGPAAVDAAGDVAFHVIVTGSNKNATNDSGDILYSSTSSTPTTIAKIGPGEYIPGYYLTRVSDPVLSGSGALAFIGTLKVGTAAGSSPGVVTAANDSGVWVYQSGTTTLVARAGETVPVGPDNFPVPVTYTGFTQIAVENSGGVAFQAGVKGFRFSSTGLFAPGVSGSYSALAARGTHASDAEALYPTFTAFQDLPTVDGQSRTIDTVNGSAAIVGELDAPIKASVGLAFSGSGGFVLTSPAELGQPSPAGGVYSALSEPVVNANGSVAFLSTIKGTGITAADNSLLVLVTSASNVSVIARTGGSAPDASGASTFGVFASLDNPVLDNNDANAFVATLKLSGTTITRASNAAIYSNAFGPERQIARIGESAPGGGKYASFLQVVLPDVGGPIFLANLSGVPASKNQALYAETSEGNIVRVVGKGDSLPYRDSTEKTVTSIGIFQNPLDAVGQSRSFDASTANIVYQTAFPGGLWGVYRVTFN